MDAIITTAIVKAMNDGNIQDFVKYVAIFAFIWIEVRGLKKAVKDLGDTISTGFRAGEERFEKIEKNINIFEHRLTVLESKP